MSRHGSILVSAIALLAVKGNTPHIGRLRTGGKSVLLGISKRGDTTIRTLLIHGARTVIRWLSRRTDPRSQWLKQLLERRGANRACVAQANKMARMAWVLMAREETYQSSPQPAMS